MIQFIIRKVRSERSFFLFSGRFQSTGVISLDSFREVFDAACEYCREELSEVAYNLWIKDIEPLSFDGSTAVLSVRSEFMKSIVEEKYLSLLEKAFSETMGFDVKVNILYQGETPAKKDTSLNPNGDYDYTFDTFIVGPSNKFAHAASLAVANNPAEAYNPLFIHGSSGLGKTHLLYAICNEIRHNRPNYNVIYIKGEQFTNELINAIAMRDAKQTQAFHEKYRSADVLAVDDIQFIAGKESTQEEFFHTFNSLFHSGKQIILTSDRPPKEIKTLEERLRTRFEWGLLADIAPPEYETRIAIIRRKAELLDLELPNNVTEYIANQLKNNIRQLEGVVKELKAHKQLGTSPTVLIAQGAIKDILSDHQPIPMTVERIITEVARTYNVTVEDIRSQKRSKNISTARQVSMYIVREITQMSMTAIGEEFGGRDHSTVVYTIKIVQSMMDHDSYFRETVDDIIKNLRAT